MVTTTTRSFFLTAFVGRTAEVNELCSLAESARLVTVVGAGGVGKTRLCYEVFDTLVPSFGDAAWAIEFADLHDPGSVGPVVASAVGASVGSERFDPGALVEYLGTQPALLYLDNCEHLVEAITELVEVLLSRCPNLRVLTSTRQALGIIGEASYPVPALTSKDAVALFLARSRSVIPDWRPTDADMKAVLDVCTKLDGVALSIELAASLMRSLTPESIAVQLSDQLETLRVRPGSEGRHASLEACLAWSIGLCEQDEKALLARLSVFPGTLSLDAAASVCGFGDLPQARVRDAMRRLVEKSLVEHDVRNAAGRYRLLEVVRQFAETRLLEPSLVTALRRAHRDYYLAITKRFDAEWFGPHQVEWHELFRVEQANLRAAFDFSLGTPGETDAALRMCTILEQYVGSAGGAGEALGWIRTAVAVETPAVAQVAEALRVGCFIACVQNALRTAREFHDQLMSLAGASADDRVRACSLYTSAVIQAWHGQPAEGAALAQDAIAVYDGLNDQGRVANLLFLRGMMLGWADRPDEAADCYRQCFDLTQPLMERYWNSYAEWGVGVERLLAGDLDAAVRLEHSALRAKAEFVDTLGLGLTLEVLAWAAIEREDGRLATLLLGATSTIWTYLGIPLSGVPYLLRRRDQALALLQALDVPDGAALQALGAELPVASVVDIALGRSAVPKAGLGVRLTRREHEIATMVAAGSSNQRIADELVISRRTVESHVESILRKLRLQSRAGVRDALRQSV